MHDIHVESIDNDLSMYQCTGEITDTIFGHLSELAFQRGLLISSTPEGNLLFTRANVNSASVGTISSGEANAITWGADFNGRKLFNSITAIGENPEHTVRDMQKGYTRFAFYADIR